MFKKTTMSLLVLSALTSGLTTADSISSAVERTAAPMLRGYSNQAQQSAGFGNGYASATAPAPTRIMTTQGVACETGPAGTQATADMRAAQSAAVRNGNSGSDTMGAVATGGIGGLFGSGGTGGVSSGWDVAKTALTAAAASGVLGEKGAKIVGGVSMIDTAMTMPSDVTTWANKENLGKTVQLVGSGAMAFGDAKTAKIGGAVVVGGAAFQEGQNRQMQQDLRNGWTTPDQMPGGAQNRTMGQAILGTGPIYNAPPGSQFVPQQPQANYYTPGEQAQAGYATDQRVEGYNRTLGTANANQEFVYVDSGGNRLTGEAARQIASDDAAFSVSTPQVRTGVTKSRGSEFVYVDSGGNRLTGEAARQIARDDAVFKTSAAPVTALQPPTSNAKPGDYYYKIDGQVLTGDAAQAVYRQQTAMGTPVELQQRSTNNDSAVVRWWDGKQNSAMLEKPDFQYKTTGGDVLTGEAARAAYREDAAIMNQPVANAPTKVNPWGAPATNRATSSTYVPTSR